MKIHQQKTEKRFFVQNQWLSECQLYTITVEGKEFTYHHLPDFFHTSKEEVISTLTSIEKNPKQVQNIKNTSLAFFKDAISTYLNDPEIENNLKDHWPKVQKLMSLDEFLNSYTLKNLALNDRVKLKANPDEFQKFCQKIENQTDFSKWLETNQISIVLDFNQSINELSFLTNFLKNIEKLSWHKAILYIEEPSPTHLYKFLDKSALKLIALDESLGDFSKLEENLLHDVAFFVVKPSILNRSTIDSLLKYNKPISLSSSYEHPSIMIGYLPLLKLDLKNEIHGLSTFDLFKKNSPA